MDPRDTFKLVETESTLWAEALPEEYYRSSLQPFHRSQEDGASQMALGRRMILSQDKVGSVL